MKKKIDTAELRIGMYVCELDRPWVGTPFLFQGFEIRSENELSRLRATCDHVYIVVGEGEADIARRSAAPVADLPGGAEDGARHGGPPGAVAEDAAHPRDAAAVPVIEEIRVAAEIDQAARETLREMIDDARLGRKLDVPRARKVIAQMTDSILRNRDAMVWLTQLRQKHEYTATHSLRVCAIALAFGDHLGYDRDRLNLLGIGALLHDIGKFRVPNELLDKPQALTDAEFEIMKGHVPEGLRLLENSPGIPPLSLQVVGRHHERLNGRGYMGGLAGDTIGEFGLVSAIVDTYDAMTSDRSYRQAVPATEALRVIYEGRQRAYDSRLVEEFIRCMGIYPIGSIVEMSTGEIGVVIGGSRARRLRPRVAIVLTADRSPIRPTRIIDLRWVQHDPSGRVLEIRNVLLAGSFGINPADHMPGRG